DRALETRWLSPILVNLDGSAPPMWYPNRNIWLDLQRYPLKEAVGAIRLRTEELGAVVRIETASDLLARLSMKRISDKRRLRFQESEVGFDAVDAQVKSMIEFLKAAQEDSAASLQHAATFAIDLTDGVALVSRFGSILLEWNQEYH